MNRYTIPAAVQAASLALGIATIPPAWGETLSVPLTASNNGGAYSVQLTLPDGRREPCMVDTGASMVMIPLAWLNRPESHTGYVGDGIAHIHTADGQMHPMLAGYLPQITVGNVTYVGEVRVVLGPEGTQCLLGQSFLSAFASVTVDYAGSRLLLTQAGR